MENIVLFDPGVRSLNKGDEIIMRSARMELAKSGLLQGRYVIHSATHAPIVTWYQNTVFNPRMKFYDHAKYKFICGSNLLWKNMMKPRPVFNVDLTNCRPYRNSILMGVGLGQAHSKTNWYTKKLYSKILNKNVVHSVRDQHTADFLKSLGYKAIDTGCPTMWQFTSDFCRSIPEKKADNVIFTLTDYGRDKTNDQKLIDILLQHYQTVYFWIQGAFDKEYFDSFKNTETIKIVDPTLEDFSSVLRENDIDYVGTRLHAGMFAMQHKKRTIIIAIDSRVRDLNAAYALHVIQRDNISKLSNLIETSFATDVQLKEDNIREWLSQFEVVSS
ncbi:MAG: polysaccharide pyruvyl transferase family protein [Lachnospiraceae bacterium]